MRITALISNSLCEEISAKREREVTMAFMWGQSSGTLLSSVFCYPGAKKELIHSTFCHLFTYFSLSHSSHPCLSCISPSFAHAFTLTVMDWLCLEWNRSIQCGVYCSVGQYGHFSYRHIASLWDRRYTILSCMGGWGQERDYLYLS